jgi:hypothetical protein
MWTGMREMTSDAASNRPSDDRLEGASEALEVDAAELGTTLFRKIGFIPPQDMARVLRRAQLSRRINEMTRVMREREAAEG